MTKTQSILENVIQMQLLDCPRETGLSDHVIKCFQRNKWAVNGDMEEQEKRMLSCIKAEKMSKQELEYVTDECERFCNESDFLSESPLLQLQVLCYKHIMKNDCILLHETLSISHKN